MKEREKHRRESWSGYGRRGPNLHSKTQPHGHHELGFEKNARVHVSKTQVSFEREKTFITPIKKTLRGRENFEFNHPERVGECSQKREIIKQSGESSSRENTSKENSSKEHTRERKRKYFFLILFSVLSLQAHTFELREREVQAYDDNIFFIIPDQYNSRIYNILNTIQSTKIGQETISAIGQCHHQVFIVHEETKAYISAGLTFAKKVTSAIYRKGEGASAIIYFDFRVPMNGSHLVSDGKNGLIEFSLIENMFHELSHARHMNCGTFSSEAPEAQTIMEENIFRKQLNGPNAPARGLFSMEHDRRIWDPGDNNSTSEFLVYALNQ